MGYKLSPDGFNAVIDALKENYLVFGPKRFEKGACFSDADLIRYGEINSSEDIVFDEKSYLSFKEVLLPITKTLFFFTEDSVKEADAEAKGAVVFLRSCDLHAVKRLDEIYLKNGVEDYYYKQVRNKIRFVLIGCPAAFDNCFCVDMGTNVSVDYDMSVDKENSMFAVDVKHDEWDAIVKKHAAETAHVVPCSVTGTKVRVNIPEALSADVASSKMWDEYDTRCINCGRCTFSCPTCTCYTMQDIFYTDNGKAGERRRVWASCMVDGFTDVAGGGSYRQKNGQRMRFKVLHKVLDYKERFGYHMCVGCGRCDDVCPEYISFSNAVNKLEDVIKGGEQ